MEYLTLARMEKSVYKNVFRDIGGQSSNPYLNIVHFFNTRVD
jgi:hypothetical protein